MARPDRIELADSDQHSAGWRILIPKAEVLAIAAEGASFRLLSILGKRADVRIHLSVPLVLEYEQASKADAEELGMSPDDIDDVLDYLCSIGRLHEIYYLWRPALRDPKDDMVLELAIAAGCDTIVTYNTRDFRRSNEFGIRIETAKEFLRRIGELK